MVGPYIERFPRGPIDEDDEGGELRRGREGLVSGERSEGGRKRGTPGSPN